MDAATLTFNEAHPELVHGMAVTGPGLDDAETEKGRHQGDAVILQIGSDKKVSHPEPGGEHRFHQCEVHLPSSEIAALHPRRGRRTGISVDR